MIGTVSEFGVYLGTAIGSDIEERAENALRAAQAFLEIHLGYSLEFASRSVTLDGEGSRFIFLPDFPITSITSAQYYDESAEEWVSYDSSLIRVNSKTGELYCNDDDMPLWPAGFQNIRIVYIAGHDYTALTLTAEALATKWVVNEIAALMFNNPGLLTFEQVDDGMIRQRWGFKSDIVFAMLSPEIISIIHSLGKRGDVR